MALEDFGKIETETVTYFMENEILNIVFKKEVSVLLEHIEENLAARRKFQQGEKVLALVDVSEVWEFSTEARKLSGQSVEELSTAMAIVTGSSISVVLVVNFYLKYNSKKIPTKLFPTKVKALEWLERFK